MYNKDRVITAKRKKKQFIEWRMLVDRWCGFSNSKSPVRSCNVKRNQRRSRTWKWDHLAEGAAGAKADGWMEMLLEVQEAASGPAWVVAGQVLTTGHGKGSGLYSDMIYDFTYLLWKFMYLCIYFNFSWCSSWDSEISPYILLTVCLYCFSACYCNSTVPQQ